MHQVRRRIGGNRQRRSLDDVRFKKQVRQRCGQKHQARQAIKEVQHCVGVAQPLADRQAFCNERIVGTKNLRHAARPTDALPHVGRQRLGCQTGGLRQIEIRRLPPLAVHLEGGVRVFGHRFHGNAAHILQRGSAQHRAGAAEKRGVPEIVAVLQQAVEQLTLVRHLAEGAQVALERIWREEVVRRLHHRQLRVLDHPAHRHLQERARGDVVAIEDGDEFALGLGHGPVEVAGLGVLGVGSGDVRHPHLVTELLELGTPAVIEHIDPQLVARPVHGHRRENRRPHDAQGFVVGGDVDVDGGPLIDLLGQRHRLALQRPQHLKIAQKQHDEGIHFGGHQTHREKGVDAVAMRHAPAQRFGQAPVHVAGADQDRQRDHHQRRQAPVHAVYPQGEDQRDGSHHGLLGDRQGGRNEADGRQQANQHHQRQRERNAPDRLLDQTLDAAVEIGVHQAALERLFFVGATHVWATSQSASTR